MTAKAERLASELECLEAARQGDYLCLTLNCEKVVEEAAQHLRKQESALVEARDALESWQRQYVMCTEFMNMDPCTDALIELNKLLEEK